MKIICIGFILIGLLTLILGLSALSELKYFQGISMTLGGGICFISNLLVLPRVK